MVSGGLISFTSPAIVAVETEMQPKTDISRLQTATSDLPVIFTVGKAVSAQSQFTTDMSVSYPVMFSACHFHDHDQCM